MGKNSPAVAEANSVIEPAPVPVDLWDELESDAAVLDSADAVLSGPEQKKTLKDVPIIIRNATFRVGKDGQFVSLEAVVGPNDGIYDKGAVVVINDGSTGIFRQICAYIEAQGWVKFPDGAANGKAGESKYDTRIDDWNWSDDLIRSGHVEVRFDESGVPTARIDFPRVWKCKHGIRLSEYPEGTTCYLA